MGCGEDGFEGDRCLLILGEGGISSAGGGRPGGGGGGGPRAPVMGDEGGSGGGEGRGGEAGEWIDGNVRFDVAGNSSFNGRGGGLLGPP